MIDYTDPKQNPYADDPKAREGVQFVFEKLKETIPGMTVDKVWDWYIQNRPQVDRENAAEREVVE